MNRGHGGSGISTFCAISGTLILAAGTYLHPSEADPNIATEAFAEYAAERFWVWIHLAQFVGVMLIVGSLVLLSRRMADGPAAQWAHLGMAGAVGSLGVTSVLQAVDGVALKVMVSNWVNAPDNEKSLLFQTALAVRQVEIGLASFGSILFGITVVVYGIALMIDHRFPRWLGALGLAGGILCLVAGLLMAHTGFSGIAMAVSMPSSMVLLVWMLSLGVFLWLRSVEGAIGAE